MITENELTKARDAALRCIQEGFACLVDMPILRLAKGWTMDDEQIAAQLSVRSDTLRAVIVAWDHAFGPDMLDHLKLVNVQVGVTYKVSGWKFATAHEAARQCAHIYLGPIDLYTGNGPYGEVASFDQLDEHFVESAAWEPDVIAAAVNVEWAEAVRQLVNVKQTKEDPSDESAWSKPDRDIAQALRENGERMTNEPLLKKAFGTVTGAGKTRLAAMVKRGSLNKSTIGDARGRGYGLPEWDNSTP